MHLSFLAENLHSGMAAGCSNSPFLSFTGENDVRWRVSVTKRKRRVYIGVSPDFSCISLPYFFS